jgi:Flp pilus assembly protein TadD/uncharacterized protein (AIM24 family)
MASAGEKDAKAGSEERTTERRMLAASAVMHAAADSSRDATGEDFLFHLYRGSELLQDNRVHEAKEELEQALTLQPRDPKGQDLLAVVYFRIGLYPRAIQIYEQLKRDNPKDASLKLNLALCYLKTGQAQSARSELEDVVRLHPTHKRAWGYLGLAYERVGDLEKAISAFERAGHAHLVRRIHDKLASAKGPSRTMPVGGPVVDADVRGVAQAAFEELDAGELSFSLAEPITGSHAESTPWKTHEPGAPAPPAPPPRAAVLPAPPPAPVTAAPRAMSAGWTVPPTAEAVASMRQEEMVAAGRDEPASNAAPSAHRTTPQAPRAPLPLADLARAARIAFPATPGVTLHLTGVALVRTAGGDAASARPFAARLEAIRVHGGALATEVLPRHTRGKGTGESFGGASSPLVSISGAGEVLLAPRPSHVIVAFTVSEGDVLAIREDILLGFELGALTYDNGRLAIGDGDTAHVVQLRGAGTVLLELLDKLQSFDVAEGHPILVRRDALLGWSGRVSPRALPPVEAPGGQRGLLALSGDGVALVSAS